MIYKYRDKFNWLTKIIGNAFGRFPANPNTWTMLSIFAALASLYFIFNARFIPAAVFFAAAAFLDIVDGAVAKNQKMVSSLGAYFDTVADRYVEFLVILGLFFTAYPDFLLPSKAWLLIALFGSLMTSYSISAAHEEGIDEKKLRGGILERAERLMMLFLIIALSGSFPAYASYIIAALAVLSNVSALQRIGIAVRVLKEH